MNHNAACAIYTPRFVFTSSQLLEMFTLQAGANDVMSDAWRTSTNAEIPYYRAAHMEGSEAIGWQGFKWWKAEESNPEQIELELIDILHFALSHKLRETGNVASAVESIVGGSRETEFCAIGARFGKTFSGPFFEYTANNPKFAKMQEIYGLDVNEMLEQFVYQTMMMGAPSWNILCCLFERMGTTPEKAHGIYVAKNALNIFRTSNGQREGSYMKIWNGREDNEHLYDYIRARVQQGELINYQLVYDWLAATYSNVELVKG